MSSPVRHSRDSGSPRLNVITDHLDIWAAAETPKKAGGRGRGAKTKKSPHGIKKLRELILELAVRGKLVPQDPNDEPASELLKKITAEKSHLIKKKKVKRQRPLPEINEVEEPFELPKGWTWSYLGQLSSDIHYGYTASAQPENQGTSLLRITDIQDNKVNWDTVPGCEISEIKAKCYLLENDDVLIARTGGTIGKSYLVENINVEAVFASYLIRVKRISSMYSPYIKTYLGSSIYWTQLYENASGTGQPNVNATALKQLFIPIPPLSEQHRIVAKVDELMALCDVLEQEQTESSHAHQTLVETLLGTLTQTQQPDQPTATDGGHAAAQSGAAAWLRIAEHFNTLFITEQSIDQLKQTILQLAVMGKLVPQDPNDEPASELLKKIAAEKVRLIKVKKIRKKKNLLDVSENEKPFELPSSWLWVRLAEITSKITDGDHKTPPRISLGYRLLSAKNVRDGFLDFDNCDHISERDYLKSRERCCPEYNDLLIVSVGGTIGRASLVPDDSSFALVRSVALIKPLFINSSYLKYAMDSVLLQDSIHARKRGGAQPCLYLSEIEQFHFSLPPLAEQHRIVAKVEELMALCDRLKDYLKESQTTQVQLTDAIVEQAII